MGRKRVKSLGTGSVKNMDACVQSHELLGRIEESLAAADYKKALRLFQNSIITILCNEGIMLVCSPYYWKGRKIKEKKWLASFREHMHITVEQTDASAHSSLMETCAAVGAQRYLFWEKLVQLRNVNR